MIIQAFQLKGHGTIWQLSMKLTNQMNNVIFRSTQLVNEIYAIFLQELRKDMNIFSEHNGQSKQATDN